MSPPTSHSKPPPIVACPSCKGDSVFAPSNPWRPFCCERCKDYDLGAWASESFRVASTAPAADDASRDDPPDNLH